MPKSSKLRKVARGRDCQIRIPGICSFNPEETVLAHVAGGGMGGKRPDLLGAWACDKCHSAVDKRLKTDFNSKDLLLFHYEAVFRTQEILLKEGLIKT